MLSDAENAFDIASDVSRYPPTVFFAIPSTYASLLDVSEIKPFDPSSVRLCVSAAEQLPEVIWSAWRDKHGIAIRAAARVNETMES